MQSQTNHRKQTLVAQSLLILIALVGMLFIQSCTSNLGELEPSVTEVATPTVLVVEPTGSPTPPPGLVVHGTVLDKQGNGVENVQIYRSYAAYPGEVIATTDAHGQYASVFYPIPGDEMVAVWAEKAGLVFSPASCTWRHYYGFEKKECNFVVAP